MFFFLLFSYQSFKELPKSLDHTQRDEAPCSAPLRTDMKPGDMEQQRKGQETGNLEAQKSLQQRLVLRDEINEQHSDVCSCTGQL